MKLLNSPIVAAAIGTIVALIVFEMFVSKALGLDTYESDYDDDYFEED